MEIREGRAVVETAGVRLQVPLDELVSRGPPVGQPAGTASASPPGGDILAGPRSPILNPKSI